MGIWGAGIFADDLACEVRDAYRDLLAEGYSAGEARDTVLRDWGQFVDDPDAGPVIWLALAVTQWRLGRLDDRTRARALRVIDGGDALIPWQEDRRAFKQRQAVLRRVRNQLVSPQPSALKVKRRFRDFCDWARGELISYRTVPGQSVIFRVIGHHTDRGGTSPIVELLDWLGNSLPSTEELRNCPIWLGKVVDGIGPFPSSPITQLFIGRLSERQLPQERVQRLGIISEPTQDPGAFVGAGWRTLDAQLEELFGIHQRRACNQCWGSASAADSE